MMKRLLGLVLLWLGAGCQSTEETVLVNKIGELTERITVINSHLEACNLQSEQNNSNCYEILAKINYYLPQFYSLAAQARTAAGDRDWTTTRETVEEMELQIETMERILELK